MQDKASWQQKVDDSVMVGPRLHGWGTFPLNGPNGMHPDSPLFHGTKDYEDVRQLVDHYANMPDEHQPTFLKTYNWIPPESYKALARYAKERGFKLSGHMPRTMTLADVIDAGQNSIAHARLFIFDCSSQQAELRSGQHWDTPLVDLYPMLIQAFEEDTCVSRYEQMAEKQVFLNPTLMTRRNDYYGVAGKFSDMLGTDYGHYLLAMEWEEDIAQHGTNISQEGIAAFRDFYHLSAATVAQASKHGVVLLAGTDSWSEYNVPGFSLHEELQAMSAAGIDNFTVLQAATINGAKYFGIDDRIGSITVGKVADLIMLDSNPILDISNTLDINTVFQGKVIYKAEHIEGLKCNPPRKK
ncbi:amidohydrolase family protein [Agaribacter marinus]|nr:amidohydrolase family protein [Agaribacter marinus]